MTGERQSESTSIRSQYKKGIWGQLRVFPNSCNKKLGNGSGSSKNFHSGSNRWQHNKKNLCFEILFRTSVSSACKTNSTSRKKIKHLISFHTLSETGRKRSICKGSCLHIWVKVVETSESYEWGQPTAFRSTAIIPLNSPLLNAKMCIDTSISSCASEIFVFSIWYVLPCPVVPVLFGQTKVNKE